MSEEEIIEAIERIANNIDLVVQDSDIIPMRLRKALIRIYEQGREDEQQKNTNILKK